MDNKLSWVYLMSTVGNMFLIGTIIVSLPDIIEAIFLGLAAVFNMTSATLMWRHAQEVNKV